MISTLHQLANATSLSESNDKFWTTISLNNKRYKEETTNVLSQGLDKISILVSARLSVIDI